MDNSGSDLADAGGITWEEDWHFHMRRLAALQVLFRQYAGPNKPLAQRWFQILRQTLYLQPDALGMFYMCPKMLCGLLNCIPQAREFSTLARCTLRTIRHTLLMLMRHENLAPNIRKLFPTTTQSETFATMHPLLSRHETMFQMGQVVPMQFLHPRDIETHIATMKCCLQRFFATMQLVVPLLTAQAPSTSGSDDTIDFLPVANFTKFATQHTRCGCTQNHDAYFV
jgi:hypothetical protein